MYMFSSMRQNKQRNLADFACWAPWHRTISPWSAHGRICLNQSVSPFEIIRKHVLRDEVIPRTPENHTGISSLAYIFVQEGMVSTVHEKKSNPHKLNLPLFTKVLWHPYIKSTMGHSPQPVSSSQDCDGCSLGPHNPTMILVVTGWMGGDFSKSTTSAKSSGIFQHLPHLEGKMEASSIPVARAPVNPPAQGVILAEMAPIDEGRPYFIFNGYREPFTPPKKYLPPKISKI